MGSRSRSYVTQCAERTRRHRLSSAIALVVLLTIALGATTAVAASVAPTVAVGAIQAVEGQAFSGKVATFTDAQLKGGSCAPVGDYSVNVDWGDGTSSMPPAAFIAGPDQNGNCSYEVSAGHSWAQAGKYQLSVSVTGPNAPSPGTGSGTATIADAALSSSCSALTATAGTGFAGTVARFTDANPDASASDDTISIAWGDGSSSSGSPIAGQTAGSFVATGSHTWAAPGTYTVTTSITDKGGATTQASCAATVGAASTSSSTTTTTSTTTSSTATTTTPGQPGITAKVSVATPGALRAGEDVHFTATATTTPGVHVYEYRWDLNGDGRYDADTGSYPSATYRYGGAADHRIGLEVLGTTTGGTSISTTTDLNVQTLAARTGCAGQLTLGFLDFLSSCIRDAHGKYSIDLDGGVGFAGVQLTSSTAGAKLTLDTTGTNTDGRNPDHKWILTADGPVTISVVNTAIGTIQLDTLDLHNSPVVLPIGANAPDQHAPGLRVFTFEAQSSCPAHGGVPPVVCATLPGNFPLTGSVSVYVTAGAGDQPGAAVAANVALQHPINITGNLTLTGDASGVQVDSFGFQSPSFNISSLVTVDPVMVSYTRQDPQAHPDGTHDMDVWLASGGAHLHVGSNVGVAVSVRFANDRFQSFSFNATGTVPLGPVILTQLGGTLGFDPFELGGNLGGNIGPLAISAGVLYTGEYAGAPWHLQIGSSDPEHDPHHVAPLSVAYPSVNPLLKIGGTLDLYGDGFISGGVSVNLGLPSVDHPDTISAGGYVRGFFMPANDAEPHPSYQLSGGVFVDVHVLLHLHGEVQGFVNNYWLGGVNTSWAAGCGSVTVDLGPFHPSVGGWVRVDLAHGDHVYDGFGGCSDISAYCAPAAVTGSHTVPACLGFDSVATAAQPRRTGRQRFWIPVGESAENLLLTSGTGIPAVTISGPSGTYVASTAASTGHLPYVSGGDAAQHQLAIAILHPKAGAYTITPLPGSPAIAPVLEAHPLPDPHIRVRIAGGGRHQVLHYALRAAPGQTVTFFERAADVSTLIGKTSRARGAIAFSPQVAHARVRTIEANVSEGGVPQKPRVVARYRAPAPPKLPRPAKLRASQHANLVTLTWRAVTGAEGYQVWVRGSDGRRQLYVLRAHRRRLRIVPVFPGTSLDVAVRAVGGIYHQPGPARDLKVKAVKARR